MRTEEMIEMDENDLEEMTKEVLILSGMELSAHHMVHSDFFSLANMDYTEKEPTPDMLKNTGIVKQANELCFFRKPNPLPHSWSH